MKRISGYTFDGLALLSLVAFVLLASKLPDVTREVYRIIWDGDACVRVGDPIPVYPLSMRLWAWFDLGVAGILPLASLTSNTFRIAKRLRRWHCERLARRARAFAQPVRTASEPHPTAVPSAA